MIVWFQMGGARLLAKLRMGWRRQGLDFGISNGRPFCLYLEVHQSFSTQKARPWTFLRDRCMLCWLTVIFVLLCKSWSVQLNTSTEQTLQLWAKPKAGGKHVQAEALGSRLRNRLGSRSQQCECWKSVFWKTISERAQKAPECSKCFYWFCIIKPWEITQLCVISNFLDLVCS